MPHTNPLSALKNKIAEADLYESQGLTSEAQAVYKDLLAQFGNHDHPLHKHIEERLGPQDDADCQATKTTVIADYFSMESGNSDQSSFENCISLIAAEFYTEALAQLNTLLDSNISRWMVLGKISECHLGLHEPEKALPYLEQASRDSDLHDGKEKLEILSRLAMAYESTGALPMAMDTLRQIMQIDPQYGNAKGRLQTLNLVAESLGYSFNLVASGLLSREELETAKAKAEAKGKAIEYVLSTEFKIKTRDLGQALQQYYRCPYVEFNSNDVGKPPACINGIAENFFRSNAFIPIKVHEGTVIIAAKTPGDKSLIDAITSTMKIKDFTWSVALEKDINQFIDLFFKKYQQQEQQLKEDVFDHLVDKIDIVAETKEQEDYEDTGPGVNDSIVVQMVNRIIRDGVDQGASDVHIESQNKESGVRIRFRIDGHCVEYKYIPFTYRNSLVSRIKILARLDISNRRLPQDGKIKIRFGTGENIELRVATIPTVGKNEDVILRILSKNSANALEDMGFREENLMKLKNMLAIPQGLILVVGPTGSGKTSSLHAVLRYLNSPEKKIWTVEDPVEIVQEGLRQVQVDNKIGYTFPLVLRSFLRADPDIIMVGELRDEVTAKIAVEASLTGHLVLSTLHTNSAAETVTRLLGMGVEPYNFADSLLGVLAQRLVRRLCPKCKVQARHSEKEIELLQEEYGYHPLKSHELVIPPNTAFYQPVGCPCCKMSGYSKRVAVHELLTVSDQLRRLIMASSPAEQLKEEAMRGGMLTLKQEGILKSMDGSTSLQQIRAICG